MEFKITFKEDPLCCSEEWLREGQEVEENHLGDTEQCGVTCLFTRVLVRSFHDVLRIFYQVLTPLEEADI